MNFLILFMTLNYKPWHNAAIHLKRYFPGSKFVGVIAGHGDIKGYLERQKDIKYEFLFDTLNLENEFLKEDVSYDELREFEETLREKSLWRYIGGDSIWGYQFCKNALLMPRIDKKLINTENLMKIAGGHINFYKRILSEFKTDVVMFFPGEHSMRGPICEQVCRNMNILHIGPTVTRVKNYLTITTNKELVFHNVNKTYKRIMDGELVIDPSPGEKIYDEMLSSLKSKDDAYYFDAGGRYSSSSNIKKHNIAFTIIRSILGTTKLFYTSRISDREKKKRFKNNSIEIKPTISLRNLPYRYYYDLYKRLQEQKLSKETFYGKYDPDEKYLFFPLHSAPEYALQQQANMWNDQLHIIDALAKSIPFDWKVYVKEHPANVIYRVRLSSFYRKIKTYANVKLIPTYLDTNMIIRNSQFVAHICGTAGWEAVLFHGKPTINFHEMFHDVTGLSKKVENLVELSREIHNEVKRIKKIDSDERKKRIICLINALCIHSISVDNPVATMGASQFYLSEEELKSAGVSFGDAVIQFIEETKSNCAKVQSSN
jgi:hypothetical protein